MTSTKMEMDYQRRFGGIARLYGEPALAKLAASHAIVIGIGGVGSWAVEALARSAVGRITLIDLDQVAESNTNRQIHALNGTYGSAKVHAMSTRIHAIHPACSVQLIEDFIDPVNLTALLPDTLLQETVCVLDAIDQIRSKSALIAHCRDIHLPIVTTGAAGGRRDPTRIQVADLAHTEHDPIAARLRAKLRKDYAFPRGNKQAFGIECVFSVEPITRPTIPDVTCQIGTTLHTEKTLHGLSCAGYGSVTMVTATLGLIAAARVVEHLLAS